MTSEPGILRASGDNLQRAKPTFDWQSLQVGYEAFSTLCDPDDWRNIIEAIAHEMTSVGKPKIRILDVGAGSGATAAAIRRRLYFSHGIASTWTLYDPDSIARSMHGTFMPPLGGGFGVESVDRFPRGGGYDAALLCHSSYYVSDIYSRLQEVWESLLRPSGKIIVVAMEDKSPYFDLVGRDPFIGAADDVVNALTVIGVPFTCAGLRSRCRLTLEVAHDEEFLGKVCTFLLEKTQPSPDEIEGIVRKLRGRDIDFLDAIICTR